MTYNALNKIKTLIEEAQNPRDEIILKPARDQQSKKFANDPKLKNYLKKFLIPSKKSNEFKIDTDHSTYNAWMNIETYLDWKGLDEDRISKIEKEFNKDFIGVWNDGGGNDVIFDKKTRSFFLLDHDDVDSYKNPSFKRWLAKIIAKH
jgi:hypothetical protein